MVFNPRWFTDDYPFTFLSLYKCLTYMISMCVVGPVYITYFFRLTPFDLFQFERISSLFIWFVIEQINIDTDTILMYKNF